MKSVSEIINLLVSIVLLVAVVILLVSILKRPR